jgi:hypothetical protein
MRLSDVVDNTPVSLSGVPIWVLLLSCAIAFGPSVHVIVTRRKIQAKLPKLQDLSFLQRASVGLMTRFTLALKFAWPWFVLGMILILINPQQAGGTFLGVGLGLAYMLCLVTVSIVASRPATS